MGKLDGTRILLAEDEFLVALTVENDIVTEGAEVVGPFQSIGKTREAIDRVDFDLAVLDINLNGEMIYPIADELLERGVPFLFLSGYIAADIPDRFLSLPRVSKPYHRTVLIRTIERLVSR